jgi:hypothetical protein
MDKLRWKLPEAYIWTPLMGRWVSSESLNCSHSSVQVMALAESSRQAQTG